MIKEKVAIYPGTFDPITRGHIDVIRRASKIFDRVHVVIGVNRKKKTMFDEKERKDMAVEVLKNIPNVEIHHHSGLTIDYAQAVGAVAMIRGIRAVSDLDYEFQLAQINRKLDEDIATVFLAPRAEYTFLNSTLVRELAHFGKDTSYYVTDYVAEKLKEKSKSEGMLYA